MVKLPTAPEKLAGGLGGSVLTSSVTASLVILIATGWVQISEGILAGCRRTRRPFQKCRGANDCRGAYLRDHCINVSNSAGPMVRLPALAAAMAVL